MKKVDSSTINALDYDPATKILTIHFHSGGVYQYENVPPEKYEALANADSVGSHFHKHIKTSHRYRKA